MLQVHGGQRHGIITSLNEIPRTHRRIQKKTKANCPFDLYDEWVTAFSFSRESRITLLGGSWLPNVGIIDLKQQKQVF
jgi:hypothetical protein